MCFFQIKSIQGQHGSGESDEVPRHTKAKEPSTTIS